RAELRVIDDAHVGETRPEGLVVAPHERIGSEGVDVVRDEHQVARSEGEPDSPGGVGQDDRLDAQPSEDPRREDDVGHRPALVVVDPPRKDDHRSRSDASENDLARVADHSARNREVRDLAEGDRYPGCQLPRERAQAGPEDQADLRLRPCLLPDRVGGLVDPCKHGRLAHLMTPSSQIRPAIAAVMNETSDPASSARKPSLARSDLRVGARPPMPPIWMPIEEKLANPQSAKVAISFPFSESCPTTSFIIEKAKNSLMTVLLAMRFPTIAASSFGAPSRIASGPRTQPKIVCRENSGFPQKCPTQPRKPLNIAISATKAISIAEMFRTSVIPCVARLCVAAMLV